MGVCAVTVIGTLVLGLVVTVPGYAEGPRHLWRRHLHHEELRRGICCLKGTAAAST